MSKKEWRIVTELKLEEMFPRLVDGESAWLNACGHRSELGRSLIVEWCNKPIGRIFPCAGHDGET